MKNYIQLNKMKPADRIVVPKSILGLVQHHAIYLGKDQLGRDIIAENIAGKYVNACTAEEFFIRNPSLTRIEHFHGNDFERQQAIKRALSLMGKPYSLIDFNCEHYANIVQRNSSFSPQVRIIAIVILIILFGGLYE